MVTTLAAQFVGIRGLQRIVRIVVICLSWLTNSVLVYEPKCGGGAGVCGVSANANSCAQWSPREDKKRHNILLL